MDAKRPHKDQCHRDPLGSSEAAYLTAGSVIEVTERDAKGKSNSGVAIVRPLGHHAEQDEAMGFCLYNNVAIATSFLLNEKDVHHGNATQKMFWEDCRVLSFFVHRHEFWSFYPANNDDYYNMVGEGPGAGYIINVPWQNCQYGDADYLAVWDHILIPFAKEFDPDIIIISAGFDAVDYLKEIQYYKTNFNGTNVCGMATRKAKKKHFC
ncbi:hypothetical protein FEM48_Zijuj05G0129300 [Ziziphus jujuba var. spinosa]|uniref:Histone deacetylase domain-containing protein n=1 Tax=Ziziphus jujuba var. spinosa TaxID=714518 RepID=A0A978VEY5_ZIZJJ|nr:hypothetical protein FEM48_Zijuj05G0129300 [Ziziphus jujuba var. spinosa]